MKRRSLLLVGHVILAFTALRPVGAADILWTNSAGGAWHGTANWSPNQVPGPNDRAVITSAGDYTVALDANAFVGSVLLGGLEGGQAITINGAALSVSGTTTINSNGLVTILGGSLGGSGDIVVEGVLNMFAGSLSGSQSIVVLPPGQLLFGGNVNLGGRQINNSGRVIWTAGDISGVSTFLNLSNAVLDVLVASNNVIAGSSLTNLGLMRRTFGTGVANLNLPFFNSGTVDIQSGRLYLPRQGTHTGAFRVASAAALLIGNPNFGPAPFQFLTNSSITGAGNVTFGCSANVNGTFAMTGTTTFQLGGEVHLSTGYSISNSPLMILAGRVYFNSGRMLFPSTLGFHGGWLAGADSMTVTGEVIMTGHGVIASSGVIHAGNGFTVFEPGDITMSSGTLNNAGLAVLRGGLRLGSDAVLNNLEGGTIQYFLAGILGQSGAPGTFNNYGLFLKSGGFMGITARCNNYGEMDIEGGILFLSEGGTHTGSFRVGPGSTLRFDPGTSRAPHTFQESSQITGDGNVGFGTSTDVSGSIAVAGDVSILPGTSVPGTNNFTGVFTNGGAIMVSGGVAIFNTGSPILPASLSVSGGVLGGSDPITVRGPIHLTGGTLSGSGAITANGGLTIGGLTLLLNGRTLNNTSVANWNEGFIFTGGGSVISNAASGIFNINFDGQTFAGFGGSRRFVNAGVLRKAGGSGTAVISDAFYNMGTVESVSGELTFGNIFTQTAGSTLLNGGNLGANGPLQIAGGVLAGNGSVRATVVNSGRVVPGGSPSLLRILGDYTQTASGQLDLELGGSTPGINFDQIQVQGTASLAGTLNVSAIGGFHPAIGETFRVLTFASRTGDFSFFNDLTGSDFHRIYDASGLALSASNSAPVLVIHPTVGQAGGGQPVELVLTWPENASDYLLQSATNIPSTAWVTIPSNGTNRITVPATAPARFFRLIKP